jgi:plasmid stabilization system protein ParE
LDPTPVPPLDAAVGTELATRLLDATEPLQRNATVAAAVAAVRAARLSRPLLEDSLDELVRHRYGGPGRDEIERLVQDLDERAWSIQSTGEGGGADSVEYLRAFRKARAAAAVKMALGTNARTAVSETVFEAAQAVDSRERLGQLLAATLDLIEPGNHRAAQDLAGLFWPRFVEVDGYVLVADHFEPDTFAEFRDKRPDSRWAVEDMINHVHVLEVAGPNARADAVGQACRHITKAWREVLDATLPGCDVTVDWDPQERIVTAFSHA